MKTINDYLNLITPFHRPRARFLATVTASVQGLVSVTNFIAHLPVDYDLDVAVGVQLDVVGEWVGVSRLLQVPLIPVWFSFDITGLGFDEGMWKVKAAPEYGVSELDDETYRDLIRYKIDINNWDGQLDSMVAALNRMYKTADGVLPFAANGQDMSLITCISGDRPLPLRFAIYATRKVEFLPAGIQTRAVVPSVEGTAAFGFDVQNEYIAGFDTGSWVIDAIDALT